MYVARDEHITKLHTAVDGKIWYARGVDAVTCSDREIDDFLKLPLASGFGNIFRLLGVAQNAELIAALYTRRKHNEVRAVEVAGPNSLPGGSASDNPVLTILQLRALIASSAAGGWHEVTMSDYPTYALIARLQRNHATFDEAAENYLRLHPVYYALSFIPTLCSLSLSQLLVSIVDPRWFAHPELRDSVGKLFLFLGLTPSVQKKVSDNKALIKSARAIRAAHVMNSWKTTDPDDIDIKKPENFLYRIWHEAGGGWRGDLRASQAFVRYMRDNWLAGLDKRVGRADGLFAPDIYFKTPEEMVAFKRHIALKR